MKKLFNPYTMKNLLTLIVFILLMGCNTTSKKEETTTTVEIKTTNSQKNNSKTQTAEFNNSNFLCKINGNDWSYTKASGIVSTHRKTKKRIVIMTFTKKLKKGSESVQLYYDTESNKLITATLQLKFKNKKENLFTCYYYLGPNTKEANPKGTLTGTINLSNPTVASGDAEISNIHMRYEKEALLHADNESVTLTSLSFDGVGYSDTDKISNTFKK